MEFRSVKFMENKQIPIMKQLFFITLIFMYEYNCFDQKCDIQKDFMSMLIQQ